MKLALNQPGIMKMGRIAMIWSRSPQNIASKTLDPLALLGIRIGFGDSHAALHSRLARGEPRVSSFLPGSDGDGQRLREHIIGPLRQGMAPGLTRLLIPQRIEEGRAQDQSDEVERPYRECAMDRS